MNTTIEAAYQEACLALGESIVMQRLLSTELARVSALVPADAVSAPAGPPVDDPLTV